MPPVRAIVFGIGSVGSSIHRVMLDKGVEIVGAVDSDPQKAGADLSDIIGRDEPTGITVFSDADRILQSTSADIAVVSVATYEISHSIYMKCVAAGVNVISTDDQCTYPWALYPDLSKRLDEAAKQQGVTITASGNQDALGVHLPMLISGCCSDISSITALVRTDLNNAGAQTCRDFHAGVEVEAFHASIGGKQEFRPFRHYAESIAAGLDLDVTDVSFTDEPLVDDVPVYCRPLDQMIEPGRVTGKSTITEIKTTQGIVIRAEYAVKVFAEGEMPRRVWSIRGNPDMYVDYTVPGVPSISRATQLVNRIPDVIAMVPGLVTIDRYPPLRYRHGPLQAPCGSA